ncbi:peptidogalycan biosysnthesis protein [Kitasatospora sp. NPDC008115]|uniref:peptidogalycan biosysnthesis protein n=1 Tax=Kitasatospora sp. NPDC008115 TaxID=3364022 RepID=UPI0036EF5E1E
MPERTLPRTEAVHVAIAPSLAAIERGQWNALVGPDNFYNSRPWLRGLEIAHGEGPVVTASLGGRLLGALPTWPGERDAPGLFHLSGLAAGIEVDRPADYLWLGARRSVFNELVCVRGPLRGVTLRALLRGALGLAASCGAAGVVMPYLSADDARELADAHPGARALLHDADANLDVPPGGFEELLAAAGQHDRTRRRAELRACARGGTAVEWSPLGARAAREAAYLVTQNRARYGGTADVGWMERSFAAQRASGVLDQAIGCFGLRDGRPVAVTVCYRHHDRLYARYYGFDYRRSRPACEYFALTYCAPVDFAAAHGLRRYRLAVSAPELKVRRGAVLDPLGAVLLPLDAPVAGREVIDALNARTVRRWRDRCRTRQHALGAAWDGWEAGRSATTA